ASPSAPAFDANANVDSLVDAAFLGTVGSVIVHDVLGSNSAKVSPPTSARSPNPGGGRHTLTQPPALANERARPGLLEAVELRLAPELPADIPCRFAAFGGTLVNAIPLILGYGRQKSEESCPIFVVRSR